MSNEEIEIKAVDSESELTRKVTASTDAKVIFQTKLKTDERVIARVTDGIYRQPGSALRELISNAYDADASKVVIKTDAPRFNRITIEDNGHGMSPAALSHLLHHIGGSAKRNEIGTSLGITSSNDPTKSPKGRKLIGKIGIGLFSVSQLTQSFQIITKVKGESFRTVATVVLRQYTDEDAVEDAQGKKTFESGKVNIWREKAADIDVHGTTIILTGIRPQAKDVLKSRDIWNAVEQSQENALEENIVLSPPKYHIGKVDNTGEVLDGAPPSLPWGQETCPDKAFTGLVNSVWNEIGVSSPNPKLEGIFDYYLQMVWQLSLGVPVDYVEQHLFDLKAEGWAPTYLLSNKFKKGNPTDVVLSGKSLRESLELKAGEVNGGPFEVLFDNLKLKTPIKYKKLPITNNALKNPLIFIGKCSEDFALFPKELTGGPLEFEAYLFWNPKIAPVEHQGCLIRINGSSGTLFDPTFMKYQVSEQTRLRQITCEIFVSKGLDSALNIDRESFNNSHPHTVYIAKWLHSALRQVASTQKKLSSSILQTHRFENKISTVSRIQKFAHDAWTKQSSDPGSLPPGVIFSKENNALTAQEDAYVFSEQVISSLPKPNSQKAKAENEILEEKIKAIAQVLASFGLLDSISKSKQEALLKTIYKIIETQGE